MKHLDPIDTRLTPGQASSGMITLTAGLMMGLLLGIMVIFAGCNPVRPRVDEKPEKLPQNIYHDPLQMFNGVPLRMNYENYKDAPPVPLSREKIERIRRQVKERLTR